MNEEQLSSRLAKVASFVKKGAKVADIGSDHAYLPVFLVKRGIAESAIAGEVNQGPLQSAANQVKKQGLEKKIKTKLGNGLSVLKGEKIDTVVIAGMGGPLITQILQEGNEQLNLVTRLILQPNIAAEHIRQWLIREQWEIVDEAILEEGGHIYEILVAEKGEPLAPYSDDLKKELWLGPFLLKEKTEVFHKKWLAELKQLEKIHNQMIKGTSSSREIESKRLEVERKMEWLKEELM